MGEAGAAAIAEPAAIVPRPATASAVRNRPVHFNLMDILGSPNGIPGAHSTARSICKCAGGLSYLTGACPLACPLSCGGGGYIDAVALTLSTTFWAGATAGSGRVFPRRAWHRRSSRGRRLPPSAIDSRCPCCGLRSRAARKPPEEILDSQCLSGGSTRDVQRLLRELALRYAVTVARSLARRGDVTRISTRRPARVAALTNASRLN